MKNKRIVRIVVGYFIRGLLLVVLAGPVPGQHARGVGERQRRGAEQLVEVADAALRAAPVEPGAQGRRRERGAVERPERGAVGLGPEMPASPGPRHPPEPRASDPS